MAHLTNQFWLWPWWALLILAIELALVALMAYLIYGLLGPGRIARHGRLRIAELKYEARVSARAVSREADELWSSAPIRRAEHQVALRLAADRTTSERAHLRAVTQ